MKNHNVEIKSTSRIARKLLHQIRTASLRMTVMATIIGAGFALYASNSSGATVTVTVSPGGRFVFSPSSITIQRGDTIQWIWDDDEHSATSGTPGSPSGLWDSGILNGGASFSHTFNTVGSFPYYCTPHGACCGMTATVTVTNAMPTPTATPPLNGPPVVTTNPATYIASFSATLNSLL